MDNLSDDFQKVDIYLNILDRIQKFINNCDNKTSVVLGFYGVFFGIVLVGNFLNNIFISLIHLNFSFTKIFLSLLLTLSMLLFFYGIVRLFMVLYAKIDSKKFHEGNLKTDSLIFYGSISKNNFGIFKQEILNLNEDKLIDDILSQIYINSKICTIKFQNFNKGLYFSFFGLLLFITFIILGYIFI